MRVDLETSPHPLRQGHTLLDKFAAEHAAPLGASFRLPRIWKTIACPNQASPERSTCNGILFTQDAAGCASL